MPGCESGLSLPETGSSRIDLGCRCLDLAFWRDRVPLLACAARECRLHVVHCRTPQPDDI